MNTATSNQETRARNAPILAWRLGAFLLPENACIDRSLVYDLHQPETNRGKTHLLDELLLLLLNREHARLDRVLGDELEDADTVGSWRRLVSACVGSEAKGCHARLGLADAVDTVDGLRFDRLLPPPVAQFHRLSTLTD